MRYDKLQFTPTPENSPRLPDTCVKDWKTLDQVVIKAGGLVDGYGMRPLPGDAHVYHFTRRQLDALLHTSVQAGSCIASWTAHETASAQVSGA